MIHSLISLGQLSNEELRVVAGRLIEGDQCKEELSLNRAYSQTQDSIIGTLTNENTSLKYSIDYSINVADSLFLSNKEVNLKLNKEKETRKNLVRGGIFIIVIETLIIFLN